MSEAIVCMFTLYEHVVVRTQIVKARLDGELLIGVIPRLTHTVTKKLREYSPSRF
jgi:hypothetical protein